MGGDMSKCGETSTFGFPVLYSYGQYKCTAASLRIRLEKLTVDSVQGGQDFRLEDEVIEDITGRIEPKLFPYEESECCTKSWSA